MKVIAYRLAGVVLAAIFMSGCAATQDNGLPDNNELSGFLSDYSYLEEAVSPAGIEYLRWQSREIRVREYRKVLLDGVEFYPAPRPEEQVDREALIRIKNFFDVSLDKAFEGKDVLARSPGPGIVEAQIVVANVKVVAEAPATFRIMPAAAAVRGDEQLIPEVGQVIEIFFEMRVTDSETGELISEAVFQVQGGDLKDPGQPLTLENMEPLIEKWAQALSNHAYTTLDKLDPPFR